MDSSLSSSIGGSSGGGGTSLSVSDSLGSSGSLGSHSSDTDTDETMGATTTSSSDAIHSKMGPRFLDLARIKSDIPSSGCPDTGYPIIAFSHFIRASNERGSVLVSSNWAPWLPVSSDISNNPICDVSRLDCISFSYALIFIIEARRLARSPNLSSAHE